MVSVSPRKAALWAGLAVMGLSASTGCQVEYAGMTLPSGKYLKDDIQYFAPGPDFPWANTQAATQRARMSSMGIPVNNEPLPGQDNRPLGAQPPAQGALDPTQNVPGRAGDVNQVPENPPPPPQPGAAAPDAAAPDAAAPAPGAAMPGNDAP